MKNYEYYRTLTKDTELKIRVPKSLKKELMDEAKNNKNTMSELILQRICIDEKDTNNSEKKKLKREKKCLEKKNRTYQESAFRISTCINQIEAGCQADKNFDIIKEEVASWLLK